VDAVAAFGAAREAQGLSTLICIAEGAHAAGEGLAVRAHLPGSPDPLRLGGAAERLQNALQPRLNCEVRSVVLGHTQRVVPEGHELLRAADALGLCLG
jgi:6-phosphofructokinase 1